MSNKFLDLNGLSRYKEKSDEELNALLSAKANKNGYYSQLTAGLAENLVDTKGTGSEQVFTDRTSCGEGSIADDGTGVIKELRGNSLAWNQLVPLDYIATATVGGVTVTNNGDGTYTINGTSSSDQFFNAATAKKVSVISGHKYLVLGKSAAIVFNIYDNDRVGPAGINNTIFTALGSGVITTQRLFIPAGTYNNVKICPRFTDLTLMFGEGKEPSTVAEFEALYPELYYPQNAGAIINNAADTLVSDGFNQWDEEWEEGTYNTTTGAPIAANDQIRTKNYIPVYPNTVYYGRIAESDSIWAFFYDAQKNLITGYNAGAGAVANNANNVGRRTFTTPPNARYMRFYLVKGYGTTYKNDICINLSWSGYRNGEYEPYWKRETGVDMRKIYGKLNGAGEMVQVFPDGGRSAGSIFDAADLVRKEGTSRFGKVVLTGSETWVSSATAWVCKNILPGCGPSSSAIICSKSTAILANGSSFPEAITVPLSIASTAEEVAAYMAGAVIYYELATPLHYTDLMYSEDGGETFVDIPTVYKVADFGTERIRPLVDAQGNPTTAPFRAVIQYNDDFTREIVNLPKNYDTTDSLDDAIAAMSSAIGAALNGALTVTRGAYNPATKKFAWSADFIPNSE